METKAEGCVMKKTKNSIDDETPEAWDNAAGCLRKTKVVNAPSWIDLGVQKQYPAPKPENKK